MLRLFRHGLVVETEMLVETSPCHGHRPRGHRPPGAPTGDDGGDVWSDPPAPLGSLALNTITQAGWVGASSLRSSSEAGEVGWEDMAQCGVKGCKQKPAQPAQLADTIVAFYVKALL